MKKGIIFDMDGTLWDTTGQVLPAWNEVLRRHNLPLVSKKQMCSFMGKTLEMIAEEMLPEMSVDDRMNVLNECCVQEQKDLRERGGALYPRLEETLAALSKDYSLYIVSNCHSNYMEAFFTAHGLKKYFADFECHGSTGLSKGENIRLIVKRNSLDKAIYVGDTQSDLDAADIAGVPFVYAKYGFGSVNRQVPTIKEVAQLSCIADSLL